MLRRFIYVDHFPEMTSDYTTHPHIGKAYRNPREKAILCNYVNIRLEHCLDGLRRSLMCHADMTFIPVRWSENRGWIMPIFDTVYTCRDYDAMKRWTRDRDAADPKTYPQNAKRLQQKRTGGSD